MGRPISEAAPVRRAGLAPALVVGLLHGALLLAWLASPPTRPPVPAQPPAAIVWLQPPARLERAPDPSEGRRPARPTAAPVPVRAPTLQTPRRRVPEPQPITLPPAASPAGRPALAARPEPPDAPASSPLQLGLPPGDWSATPGLVGEALNDPRANSARRGGTALSRLGDRSPALAEQAMAGEGRRRVTIDGHCSEVHEARIQQIDPFNRSNSPIPGQVKSCD